MVKKTSLEEVLAEWIANGGSRDETRELEHAAEQKAMKDHEDRLAAAGWPWPLIKATSDYFDYALKLRSGETIFFRDAEPSPCMQWATLEVDREKSRNVQCGEFERGIVVRVSDIVWCADAPHGS